MALKTLKTTPLNRAREIFADLLALDVLDGGYDAEVAGNPREHAMRLTDGLDLSEVRRLTNDLRAERRRVARAAEAKAEADNAAEDPERWDGLA